MFNFADPCPQVGQYCCGMALGRRAVRSLSNHREIAGSRLVAMGQDLTAEHEINVRQIQIVASGIGQVFQ